jgi:hypothetical protein
MQQITYKTTHQQHCSKFNPVIKNSFNKVGADQIWICMQSQQHSFGKKVNQI